MANELVSLPLFKAALGIDDTDTTSDLKYAAALEEASDAIRTYLERSIGLPTVTETRTFEYRGDGIVEIDDCVLGSITSVVLDSQALVANVSYRAEPSRASDVHEWLEVPIGYGISPAMGFTWNLDTYLGPLATAGQVIDVRHSVVVSATWGWPTVPTDIRRAAVWTAASFADNPKSLSQQHFESYTVSYGPDDLKEAIPDRAKAVLDSYIRRKV